VVSCSACAQPHPRGLAPLSRPGNIFGMKRLTHALWFACAAIFLIEAWLWDALGGLLHRLVALLPFETWKRLLGKALESLPAPVVLLVFLIPIAVIEPFKLVAIWALTHHHIFLGVALFVAAKFAGIGITAFLFEATRTKLLSMGWFARFYDWVLRLRAKAHAFLEPYKIRIHAALAPFKQKLREVIATYSTGHSGLGRRLMLLRAHVQKLRGTPGA
jgi:hypothetical protein